MEKYRSDLSKEYTSFGILMFLLMSLVLLGTTNSLFSKVNILGFLSISTILLFSNLIFLSYVLKKKTLYMKIVWIQVFALFFLLTSIIGLINNPSVKGVINTIQFFMLINMFIFMSLIKWSEYLFKVIRKISIIFILFHLFVWLIQSMPIPFGSIYPSNNLIGAYIYFIISFVLLYNHSKFNYVYLIISLILIYVGESRSIFISVLITLLIYIFWEKISKNLFRMLIVIFTVLISVLSFTFIYPQLHIIWSGFYRLNQWSLNYTGKNIYSGREEIWSKLIDIILQKPLFGYGPGILTEDVISTTVSAHNFYLQIALQNGIIGLFLFLMFFIYLWCLFYYNRCDKYVRLSASYFIGILFYQLFEVSLTQNQLSIGIMQWLIISIGISRVLYRKSNKLPTTTL